MNELQLQNANHALKQIRELERALARLQPADVSPSASISLHGSMGRKAVPALQAQLVDHVSTSTQEAIQKAVIEDLTSQLAFYKKQFAEL